MDEILQRMLRDPVKYIYIYKLEVIIRFRNNSGGNIRIMHKAI